MLSVAAQMDPVLAAIEHHEQGVPCTIVGWVEALNCGVTYDSILTAIGRDKATERFLAAAPTTELLERTSATGSFAIRLQDIWERLTNEVEFSVLYTNLPPLVDKFAEITSAVITEHTWSDLLVDHQMKIVRVIQDFYLEAITCENVKLLVTVFKLQGIVYDDFLAEVAANPVLPSKVIEQYAFEVPQIVAEGFVANPNTPDRLRPLIHVTLPHLAKSSR